MSWFTKSITEIAGKVQDVIPKNFDHETMLEKLTLTTPELRAERQRLDAEEKRKEHMRNLLAGMLPWESRDPDREILVDECKDAILQLSTNKETFYGPYHMPKLDAKTDDDDDDDDEKDNKEKEGEDDSSNKKKEEEEDEDDDGMDPRKPSKVSLEKLAKLEPLPPLLNEFDFQAHIGLIERMLKEDKKLVEMQSNLSGGGERERVFWRNYFFHCAYTRYECGLSIDEIWSELSDEERAKPPITASTTTTTEQHVNEKQQNNSKKSDNKEDHDDEGEETITFHDHQSEEHSASALTDNNIKEGGTSDGKDAAVGGGGDNSNTKTPAKRTESGDYEIVGEDNTEEEIAAAMDDSSSPPIDDDDVAANLGIDEDDYELDELEAEIARELEDD